VTETHLGTLSFVGSLFIALGSYFYMLGGRNGKWKRRFIGSFIVCSAIWLVSVLLGNFSWWLTALYPLCIGSFVLGYGSDTTGGKILKRSIVVSASLVSGLLLAFIFNKWSVVPIEVVIASVTVYLGVRNPIQAAPEEFFVCMCLWLPKLMYLF